MANNTAIIDDQDARIDYTGSWTHTGSDVNFSHTLSAPNGPDATLSFSFSGTWVAVVGDYDVGGSCQATFAVDSNVSPFSWPAISSPEHQQTIFTSPVLNDGDHTLLITIPSCQSATGSSSGSYLSIDYILYTVSANADTDGITYFIDDADPRVRYAGNWTSSGEDGDFRHTKHGGLTASTLQFIFNGTYISVHGRVNNGTAANAQGTFSVDGSSPASFNATPQANISYNKELFTSASLSLGQHSLTVTSQTDNPLWVDYFLVQPGASSSPPSPPSQSHSSLAIPTIVGIVVGAVVLIAIAAIVFFLWRSGNPPFKKPRPEKRRSNIIPDVDIQPVQRVAPGPDSDGASTLYRFGDGYSSVLPTSPNFRHAALLATSDSHNYPPSSSAASATYSASLLSSSGQSTDPLLPSSNRSRSRSRSYSRGRAAPSSSGFSTTSSGLTRMRSVTVSHSDAGSETGSETTNTTMKRRENRGLPSVPGSTSSHVDSGFTIENPHDLPPAYTPRLGLV